MLDIILALSTRIGADFIVVPWIWGLDVPYALMADVVPIVHRTSNHYAR